MTEYYKIQKVFRKYKNKTSVKRLKSLTSKFFEKYFESEFARKKKLYSFKGNKDVFNSCQSIDVKLFASHKLLVSSY